MSDSDLFRDTWVRYLGYANEVGESFRGVVSKSVVNLSYKVAFCYVAADTFAKSLNMTWHEENTNILTQKLSDLYTVPQYQKPLFTVPKRNNPRPTSVLLAAGDAFIWQTLASVVIPGFTINRLCAFSGKTLASRAPKMDPKFRSGLVVFIGLASIPIIVRPIDKATTVFMNCTYRKIFPSSVVPKK